MRKRLMVAAAIAFMATGCSGDGESDTASAETGGDMPACSDVWVEGETLPTDYEGCDRGDSIEAPVTYDCKDGSKFTGYDDRYYAILGGEIHTTDDQQAYSKAFNACTAD